MELWLSRKWMGLFVYVLLFVRLSLVGVLLLAVRRSISL